MLGSGVGWSVVGSLTAGIGQAGQAPGDGLAVSPRPAMSMVSALSVGAFTLAVVGLVGGVALLLSARRRDRWLADPIRRHRRRGWADQLSVHDLEDEAAHEAAAGEVSARDLAEGGWWRPDHGQVADQGPRTSGQSAGRGASHTHTQHGDPRIPAPAPVPAGESWDEESWEEDGAWEDGADWDGAPWEPREYATARARRYSGPSYPSSAGSAAATSEGMPRRAGRSAG